MIVSSQCELRYATLEQLEVWNTATALQWLSDEELALWNEFRSPVRKGTFLGGRILGKQLLQAQLWAAANVAPKAITIRSSRDYSSGSRPRVILCGRRLVYSLSISHTCDSVLVGGTNRFGVVIGVDLMLKQSLGAAFERNWLTVAESDSIRKYQDAVTVADIWAAKEAVYKACHHGEAFAPQRVEIHLAPTGMSVHYHDQNLQDRCRVSIWHLDSEVAALAIYERLHPSSSNGSESSNSCDSSKT